MPDYFIPTGSAESRLTDRSSRFLGYAEAADSEETALAVLSRRSRQHHDATHHCWAFRVGDPLAPLERSSDAGEPSGTAGKPILLALQSARLVHTILIVTRWFGGTKLGKGGLVRAYGGCALATIELLPKRAERPTVRFTIECGYDQIGLVEQVTAKSGGEILGGDYGESARISVKIPAESAESYTIHLNEASAGRVTVQKA